MHRLLSVSTALGLLCLAPLATPQWTWAEGDPTHPSGGPQAKRYFGASVAIDGDRAVVGAFGDTWSGFPAGAAYVYARVGTAWLEEAVLTPSDAWFDDRFGVSVDVDGDTVVVGAPLKDSGTVQYAGAVYVFERSGSVWSERARLNASDPGVADAFGQRVAISGDTVVCGAPGHDETDSSGNLYVDQGSAYVFARTGAAWTEQAKLLPSVLVAGGGFARSVAIAGDVVVAGVMGHNWGPALEGAVHVFRRGGTTWTEEARLTAADGFPANGFGGAVSVVDDAILAGASGQPPAGAAYLFSRSGTVWSEDAKLTTSDPEADAFGYRVALTSDLALIGDPNAAIGGVTYKGSAYVFRRTGLAWVEEARLAAGFPTGGGNFGAAVALDGNTAWVGALWDDTAFDLPDVRGLAPGMGAGGLHQLDLQTGHLATTGTPTAFATMLATFGPHHVKSLALDPATGTLFGVDTLADTLVVVDVASATLQVVGPVGFDRVHGLAYDGNVNVLFGVDRLTNQLITIDTATGAGAAVGPLGTTGFTALAFDPGNNQLYGVGGVNNLLFRVNRNTGKANLVGTIGNVGIESLAFDSGSKTLYCMSGTALMTIDTSTGTLSKIPSLSGAGRAHVFEREPAPLTAYCTAGTSGSGCLASLSAAGTASATAASGFDLMASNVEGDKDGLFFFGTNGRQANPWGNGTSFQCVAPPVKRGGLLTGVGTLGACDGSFSQDLNARWTARPSQNPGAGVFVQAQLWHRDPFSSSNQTTGFSDAIEFVVLP